MSAISGPTPTWALPADVRAAGTAAVSDYKAAVGFEQMLAGQLIKSMVSESSLGEGPYASTMQDTLTTALTSGHGLGLARQIYKEMQS
jgi:Rod binding domain-containing protein